MLHFRGNRGVPIGADRDTGQGALYAAFSEACISFGRGPPSEPIHTDVDALFVDWEESLSGNGYPVTQGADDLLDRSIEFSGPGIANAKIIVAPTTEDGRSIIEFDATLD